MTLNRIPMIGRQSVSLSQCYTLIPPECRKRQFVRSYMRELSNVAKLANIDRAVLVSQSAEETTKWTSNVFNDYNNPAGMKNLDATDYIAFQTPETAARAHVVQMCAYVYGVCPPAIAQYLPLAPRFNLAVSLYGGSVKYLDQLGNGRWAEDPMYAQNIKLIYDELISGNPVPAIVTVAGCPNQTTRTEGMRPSAIVYHRTNDDNFDGTRSWFLDPSSFASSNYVIDRDGTIYMFVPPSTQAYTNNDVRMPRTDIPLLNRALKWAYNGLPYSVNDWTISIEHVCRIGETFTEQQYLSTIALSKKLLKDFGIVPMRGTMWRHSDINNCSPTNGGCDENTGRWYCPGPEFDLARVITACGGDPMRMS